MKKSYYNYWGKANKEGNYHLLPYHMLDVAASYRLITTRCTDTCHRHHPYRKDLINQVLTIGMMTQGVKG